jgi:hypothetical protein
MTGIHSLTGKIANVPRLPIKKCLKILYIVVSYCDKITRIKTKRSYTFSISLTNALPQIKVPLALRLRRVIKKGFGITLPSTYIFAL